MHLFGLYWFYMSEYVKFSDTIDYMECWLRGETDQRNDVCLVAVQCGHGSNNSCNGIIVYKLIIYNATHKCYRHLFGLLINTVKEKKTLLACNFFKVITFMVKFFRDLSLFRSSRFTDHASCCCKISTYSVQKRLTYWQ